MSSDPVPSQQAIDRYLAREMTVEECERFEIAMLEDPELAHAVERQRVRDAAFAEAMHADRQLRPHRSLDEDDASRVGPLFRRFASPLGAGAAMACAFALGAVMMVPREPAPRGLPLDAELYFQPAERSSVLPTTPADANLVVVVSLDAVADGPFRAVVTLNGRRYAEFSPLPLAADGHVRFMLEELPAGTYRITVLGADEHRYAEHQFVSLAD